MVSRCAAGAGAARTAAPVVKISFPRKTPLVRIIPTCPNEIFPDILQGLGIYDPVIVTSDGEHLLIPIYLYKPGCIQTREAAGLSQVGQISVPTDILTGMWNEFLYTQDALYLSKEDQDGTKTGSSS